MRVFCEKKQSEKLKKHRKSVKTISKSVKYVACLLSQQLGGTIFKFSEK